MKAADITDEAFIDAIRACRARDAVRLDLEERHVFVTRWDVADELNADFPEKVLLAKARKLIRRGLIDGCACGCRGEIHHPRRVVAERRVTVYGSPGVEGAVIARRIIRERGHSAAEATRRVRIAGAKNIAELSTCEPAIFYYACRLLNGPEVIEGAGS